MKDINIVNLPAFYLFKNLVMEDPYEEDSLIISYEWMKEGKFEELQRLIPQPDYPEKPDKIKLFKERFGEDIIPEDISEYYFDDSPAQLGEDLTDSDIFDESYTILWICPGNKDRVLETLLQHLKDSTDNFKRVITEVDLFDIWANYLDRIWIYSDDNETYAVQMVTEIKEELPDLISRLPNAPSESTWEEFEKMLI